MNPKTEECKQNYEGKIFYTVDDNTKFEIIKFINFNNVIVRFNDGYYTKTVSMSQINKGLRNPFCGNKPFIYTDSAKMYNGMNFKTNSGDTLTILNGASLSEVKYQIQDEFGYIGQTTIQNIRKGQIRNPYTRLAHGGYLGQGPYCTNEFKLIHTIWNNMLTRAAGFRKRYNQSNYNIEAVGTYEASFIICQKWYCYNTFADWYVHKLAELNPNCKYEINKDILIHLYAMQTNGVKIYSPDTIEFIPEDLNTILFNTKNKPSEMSIKTVSDLADNYHSQNMLTDRAYYTIKRFFCGDLSTPVYTSIVPFEDQELIRRKFYE